MFAVSQVVLRLSIQFGAVSCSSQVFPADPQGLPSLWCHYFHNGKGGRGYTFFGLCHGFGQREQEALGAAVFRGMQITGPGKNTEIPSSEFLRHRHFPGNHSRADPGEISFGWPSVVARGKRTSIFAMKGLRRHSVNVCPVRSSSCQRRTGSAPLPPPLCMGNSPFFLPVFCSVRRTLGFAWKKTFSIVLFHGDQCDD